MRWRQGVEIDMPMLEALKRCPQARALRTDMPRYREVSRRLLATYRDVVPRLEPFGLAAMYGELPGPRDAESGRALGDGAARGGASGARAARPRGHRVGEVRGARRRRGTRRTRGWCSCVPTTSRTSWRRSPVTRLDGVGRKTAATLAELGAETIGDVRALGRDRLQEAFGVHGLRIFANAAGDGGEPIRATAHPQSISREATVRDESLDVAVLGEQLAGLAHQLEVELARQKLVAGKLTLKLRFADEGTSTTRTQTLGSPVSAPAALMRVAEALLARTPGRASVPSAASGSSWAAWRRIPSGTASWSCSGPPRTDAKSGLRPPAGRNPLGDSSQAPLPRCRLDSLRPARPGGQGRPRWRWSSTSRIGASTAAWRRIR